VKLGLRSEARRVLALFRPHNCVEAVSVAASHTAAYTGGVSARPCCDFVRCALPGGNYRRGSSQPPAHCHVRIRGELPFLRPSPTPPPHTLQPCRWRDMLQPNVRYGVYIGTMLSAIQQFTGSQPLQPVPHLFRSAAGAEGEPPPPTPLWALARRSKAGEEPSSPNKCLRVHAPN
jgi:hypothetical protein